MSTAVARFVPVGPGFSFIADGSIIEPPAELSEAVREALAEPGRFDGQILAVTQMGRDELRASTARYAHYLAERGNGRPPQVRPLAVTGVMRVGSWLVFGKRGPDVLQDPGSLELAPSGGIEPSKVAPDGSIGIADQLRQEFAEELGAPADWVREVKPIGLVIDDDDGVIDVVCLAEIDTTREGLVAAHAAHGSAEYASLHFVDAPELARWKLWPDPVSRASATILSSIDPASLWIC